jgi:type I restriction enzyme S subunit
MSLARVWEHARLGDIAPALGCKIPSPDTVVWNLSLEDIESETGRILKTQVCRVSQLGSSKCGFDERHVLFGKLRPYLNKVVLPVKFGVGTSELVPMLPDKSRLSREYLAWYLRSPEFVEFATKNSRGANLPRISMDALWNHQIRFPSSLMEQERIVGTITSALAKVEEVIEIVERSDEQISELKRSLVIGCKLSDRKWQILENLVDWVQDSEPVVRDTEYKFAGIRSFGKGLFEREVRIGGSFAYKSLRRLRTGDFIFPKLMAWEGAFSMVRETFNGMCVSPEFVVFRPKTNVIVCEVLDTYFRSPVCLEDVRNASTGSNKRRRRLNPKAFLRLKMPVPSQAIQEQLKSIYTFQDDCDRTLQERREKLQLLRRCILRKSFAGEM